MSAKQILKSKTMLFSIGLSVLGIVEANMQLLAPFMSPEMYGYAATVIGAIVAILRIATNQPLKDK